MAIVDYNKALKLGEKEYRSAISKGEYPYLPVLDDVLSHYETESQVSLGLVQVPIKKIVGTYSAGRTTAFARNFMPILESGSEFSTKWSELVDSLMEEGLRDPIKAYEFGNRFYVMEGNKRVSASKYIGAVSIEANVTRVVPKKRDDSSEINLLYEYYDFYELTKINYVTVRLEGGFKKLLKYTGHDEETAWSEEEQMDFRSAFTFFEQEFVSKGGEKLPIGSGDAFAIYLEIFGYEETKNKSQNEFKKDIGKIWNEFTMNNSVDDVVFLLNPTPESRKPSIAKLFPVGSPVLKIAFLHDRSVQNSSWTYAHELGRKYIQDVYGDKIDTCCIERVDEDTADDVFEAAIEAGNKVIFATTPKLYAAAMRAAVKHSDVKILACSMMHNHKLIRSYYLRTYEAKFISGAIAGALSEGGYIGYLSDYPIRTIIAEINAFALGVQMTNPRAKVVLEWKMVKDRDYMQAFKDKGVRLISALDLNSNNDPNRDFGLFSIGEDGTHYNLAAPVRDWGKLYEEIIGSIMRGAYKNDEAVAGDQSLNYYWGMSSGAVDIVYSRNLPEGAVRLLRTMREGIRSMVASPFTGPIYSQDGELKCEDGQVLSPTDAVMFDWLVSNIEGHIPDISELKEEAIGLVEVQGVHEMLD